MHFSFTGQYTPQALNGILESPTVSRYEAVKKLIEAAEGKIISMYSTAVEGPGVLIIFDVPDPAAAAVSGIAVASGTLHHVRLTRLMTQDEIAKVRERAGKLRASFKAPGK
jgi:uncharacterized protein with GYD domain